MLFASSKTDHLLDARSQVSLVAIDELLPRLPVAVCSKAAGDELSWGLRTAVHFLHFAEFHLGIEAFRQHG